jgi:hypothetical protein
MPPVSPVSDQPARRDYRDNAVVVVQIFVAERNAESPLANQGGDLVFDQLGAAMVGEAGSTKLIARSVVPSSRPPASDVIAPPSNVATTARLATGGNSNSVALHSVSIGELLRFSKSPYCKRTFADSEPRCTYSV